MCKATIELVSPGGVPVTVEVGNEDEQKAILELVARAEQIGLFLVGKGWSVNQQEQGPSATELANGPTFAGYPCSPTVDERGLPTWIIVDGKQAQRRDKQGDVWYSLRMVDGNYVQVLRIPKGEKTPDVRGLT